MKQYKAGILGYGFMGKAHTYGYKTMQLYYDDLPFNVKLGAVFIRDAEKGKKLCERHGFEYASRSEDEIINDPDIDIINICTPNHLHKDAILKCIKAGKHIYCEKPMVLNCDEAKEIERALKEHHYNKTAQMVFHNRYFPTSLRAKEIIEQGHIGRILTFRACYLHPGSSVGSRPATWRFLPEMTGGGTLFDAGSHVLDLLVSLLGREYASVLAASQIAFPQRPSVDGKSMVDITVDDATYMIMKLKNGALGTIECSKIATGVSDELRFEIHGEKGALAYNSMTPNYLGFYDAAGPDSIKLLGADRGWKEIECCQHYRVPGGGFPHPRSSIGWLRGHVHSLYAFMDSVFNGRPGCPSLEDGAYIQYVMEKVAKSAESGHWENL
ncbi:oxidoreductase [Spirochaetia bacterium]|nr:oxidoreductase [Spirochaetia bacterium]